MTKHYWDREAREWVEYDHRAMRAAPTGPFIVSDIPAYKSPLGTGWIEGRTARREEMKRHNVREVDPSEYRPTYHNKDFAKKLGKEWAGDLPRAQRLPTVVGPNVRKGEQ